MGISFLVSLNYEACLMKHDLVHNMADEPVHHVYSYVVLIS